MPKEHLIGKFASIVFSSIPSELNYLTLTTVAKSVGRMPRTAALGRSSFGRPIFYFLFPGARAISAYQHLSAKLNTDACLCFRAGTVVTISARLKPFRSWRLVCTR